MCGAVMAGLGFGKKAGLPKVPSDLPWRKGRKSEPIGFPETQTETPILRAYEDSDEAVENWTNGTRPRRFVLQNGQYVEVGDDNRVLICSGPRKTINPMWEEASFDVWDVKLS